MTVHAHPSQPSLPGHPASCLTSVPGSARPALPCPAAPQGFSKERSRETDPPRKFPTGAKLAQSACWDCMHCMGGGAESLPCRTLLSTGEGVVASVQAAGAEPRFCLSSSLFSMCIGHPRLLRASSPAAAHFDYPLLLFPLSSSPVPAGSGYWGMVVVVVGWMGK